jgi:hypothetical protein
MTPLGHKERFPPTRLSARCEFRKETIAGTRGNGKVAPIAAIPISMVESSGSTLTGSST